MAILALNYGSSSVKFRLFPFIQGTGTGQCVSLRASGEH